MYNSRFNQILDIYINSKPDLTSMYFKTEKKAHKGKSFKLVNVGRYDLILDEDGENVAYHYSKVFDAKADGEIIYHDASDLLGRPMKIGDFVVFTYKSGMQSMLGFGKIESVSPSGGINVVQKIGRGYGRGKRNIHETTRTIKEEYNVIKAPILEEDIMFGILTDFDHTD